MNPTIMYADLDGSYWRPVFSSAGITWQNSRSRKYITDQEFNQRAFLDPAADPEGKTIYACQVWQHPGATIRIF